MSKIMRPYIENIVNVKGDDNCGFQVIARHMGMDEEITYWYVMYLFMSWKLISVTIADIWFGGAFWIYHEWFTPSNK